jgi:methionyl-tRNA formyltransferase
LHEVGYDIAIVVSKKDKRRGRGGGTAPSPVKAAALELGLQVSDDPDDLLTCDADLGVVVAYGRIIKPHILERLPLVNIHFSLLPRWRGAAPVERAILEGDPTTGVCLMTIEEGLDTGGVYACEELAIGEGETLDELNARLVELGTRLLLDRLRTGLGAPVPQDGEATYAEKIDPGELRIEWSQPVERVHRLVRLGEAWTEFRGKRLKVRRARPVALTTPLAPGELAGTAVGTGDGAMELLEVQPEGKRTVGAAAWVNGAHPSAGERLGP